MASVNKVILLGNLGADPELKYTPAGYPVCRLSVATSETYMKDGSRQTKTQWHRVVIWNKQAESCAKYLSKGRTVYCEGKLATRTWQDKDTGKTNYATEITAQSIQFIGGGKSEKANDSDGVKEEPFIESPSNGLDDIPF